MTLEYKVVGALKMRQDDFECLSALTEPTFDSTQNHEGSGNSLPKCKNTICHN